MTTEKLKRVQSVRKWLEKAEQSFSRQSDVSGELNLMMARAELQRLDETSSARQKRKLWGNRVLAMAVAATLIFGISQWESPAEPAGITVAPVAALADGKEAPRAEGMAAEALPEGTDEPMQQEPQIHAVRSELSEQEPMAPLLSEWEIQRVVGEAGRALRGQS